MQTEEWGPYRIEERLGTGGMGEVYRAYDRRLDRWVALKIIRPEADAGKKARERFRREARSAARLSHPTVLQIHDIIEREEGDGIVMELVEGETLGKSLKRGPMELDRVVRLAREIAEGLAAAHARGIVHRDLKADNVMITPEDHAKILDFGLAKRLDPSAEQSISIDGRVVGTSHAMSPEQAQGFEVDHRSDLFSLGILLYEMVTGTSPFRRPALAETLTRVCVHEQTPVKELRPEVPAELSDLVDELLRKKPEDRPQEAREVMLALRHLEPAVSVTMDPVSYPTMVDLPRATATGSTAAVPSIGVQEESTRGLPGQEGTESWWYRTVTLARRPVAWGSALAVIAVAAMAGWLLAPSPPPSIQVAVPEPGLVSVAAVEDPTLLASGLRVALTQGLLDLEGVTTLAPDQVDTVDGTSQEIARATAADEVLTSGLACTGLRCQMTLNRVGRDGGLLSAKTFPLSSDDLLLAAQAAIRNVRELYREYPRRAGTMELRISEEDYESYLRVNEASVRRDEGVTLENLLERVAGIRASSPEFLPAYLLEASLARARYLESRDVTHLQRAYEVIGEARELAPPRDPRPLSVLAWIALDAKDVTRAEEALSELEQLVPGDDRLLVQKAYLQELKADPQQAMALAREAYRRRPSWENLFNLAQIEYRQGAVAAARDHLEELLKLVPDHFDARYLLAQLELLNGDPERAAELFAELVAQSPGTLQMGNLGVAHLVAKQYREAAAVSRQAYELDPQSALLALNLADAELLVGRTEEARELYQRVLDLTEKESYAADPQLLTVRAQAFAHLERNKDAVGAVHQALRLAPDHPQVAFEAALVYTLVGDEASALVNVERARDLGVEAGWFRFPWFDPLRTDLEFQAMTETRVPTGTSDLGRDSATGE